MNMPFEDSAFDLVWSLESGEHMPDKKKFVNELMRVVAPGGRIIIVTWCHRDLERGEPSLSRKEEKILAKINRAYYLRYQDTTVEENGKWYPARSIRQVSEAMGVSRGSANLCVINAELELKKNNIICSKHNPYLGVICDWLDQVSSL